ncbi:immunity protein [Streptococcus thermophilus]|uniref:immunity protein n=1 Tax=Streptococcus thermophilus TaxID=1308 RepID=UPI003A810E7B
MKYHLSRLDKLLLIRCLMGQLPIIGILSIFLSQEFFTLPLLTKVVIILIFMGITIYFTKEIKLEQAKENTHFHAKAMQISFIVIALIFGFIDLYRGVTAVETYQQVIGYIGAFICIVIAGLLVWGLKFIKD